MEYFTNLISSESRPESWTLSSFVKGESVDRTKIVTSWLPLQLTLSQISYFEITKTDTDGNRDCICKVFPTF